jgi:copper chaperone CopZ
VPEKIEIKVKGMSCAHCEMRVSNALKSVEGVKDASADHKSGKAIITEKDNKTVDIKKLVDAVNAIGYQASID